MRTVTVDCVHCIANTTTTLKSEERYTDQVSSEVADLITNLLLAGRSIIKPIQSQLFSIAIHNGRAGFYVKNVTDSKLSHPPTPRTHRVIVSQCISTQN